MQKNVSCWWNSGLGREYYTFAFVYHNCWAWASGGYICIFALLLRKIRKDIVHMKQEQLVAKNDKKNTKKFWKSYDNISWAGTLKNSTAAPSAIPSSSRTYCGNEFWTLLSVSSYTSPVKNKTSMDSISVLAVSAKASNSPDNTYGLFWFWKLEGRDC